MAGQGDSNLTRLERMERRLQSLDAEAINRATRPCATTTIRRMGTLRSLLWMRSGKHAGRRATREPTGTEDRCGHCTDQGDRAVYSGRALCIGVRDRGIDHPLDGGTVIGAPSVTWSRSSISDQAEQSRGNCGICPLAA